MPVIVYTLVVIVFNGATATSYTRDFQSEGECAAAEEWAHDAAKVAIGVTDVGTKCLRSDFSPLIKPRA